MKAFFLSVSLLFLALLPGCATQTPTPSPQSLAPIKDFAEIAGKWEGLMTRAPHHPGDDWVEVVITQDGAYRFSSYRQTGLFKGEGKLTLVNGQAVEQWDGGGVTFTQYTTDGKKVLRAVGTGRGMEYESNLTPAR